MGGHGGLNILPQKSWHVYRNDNRERVRRDEENHEKEEKNRKSIKASRELQNKIILLRRKEKVEEDSSEGCEEGRVEDESKSVFPSFGSEKSRKTTSSVSKHINLFKEEEEILNKRMIQHQRYLEKVGYDSKDVSSFNVCTNDVRKSWYTQSHLPSEIVYSQHINDLNSVSINVGVSKDTIDACTNKNDVKDNRKILLPVETAEKHKEGKYELKSNADKLDFSSSFSDLEHKKKSKKGKKSCKSSSERRRCTEKKKKKKHKKEKKKLEAKMQILRKERYDREKKEKERQENAIYLSKQSLIL